MNFKFVYTFCVLVGCIGIVFSSAGQTFRNNIRDISEPFVVSADSIFSRYGSNAQQLALSLDKAKAYPSGPDIHLAPVSKEKLTASEIFDKAKHATVIMGSAYLCPHCSHTHVSNATGYIIATEGVVVTNYHVLRGFVDMEGGNRPLSLLARTYEGKTYGVKEVLYASEQDDLVVLKLDADQSFSALGLSSGARVGDDAYVLGHPRGMYYYFTKGMVNSKFQEQTGGEDRGEQKFSDVMTISADYAAGASGGPVLDVAGNLIGTVSSTRTFTYNDDASSVQMIVKYAIPVESLRRLIGR